MRTTALRLSVAVCALYLAGPASAADLAEAAPPPTKAAISASIDFVYATRELGDNHVVIEDTTTGNTILDSNDFDFGWEPGVDARLNLASGNYGFGFRFFGGFDFNDTTRLTTSPIWDVPTIPQLFGLGTANVNAKYETSLDSAELNVSRQFGNNAAVFIGFRGIVLEVEECRQFWPERGHDHLRSRHGRRRSAIGRPVSLRRSAICRRRRTNRRAPSGSDISFNVRQGVGPAFTANSDAGNWLMVAEGGLVLGFKVSPST